MKLPTKGLMSWRVLSRFRILQRLKLYAHLLLHLTEEIADLRRDVDEALRSIPGRCGWCGNPLPSTAMNWCGQDCQRQWNQARVTA